MGRKLEAAGVTGVVFGLFVPRGVPARTRSDHGPEFVAEAAQGRVAAVGAGTAHAAPGGPRENGRVESFDARLRDELLDGGIFCTLREAEVVVESWRRHCDSVRPHAPPGFRPPAPEVFVPALAAWPAAPRRPVPLTIAQVVAPRPGPDPANRSGRHASFSGTLTREGGVP